MLVGRFLDLRHFFPRTIGSCLETLVLADNCE